jgi:hypothetical protein
MVCIIKAYYDVTENESFKNEFKKVSKDECGCDCDCKEKELFFQDHTFDRRCECNSDDKRNELIYRDHKCECNSYKKYDKSRVEQMIIRIPLYNECSCKKIGTIQFNNIEYNKKICHDNLYDVTENISIQFDDTDGTQIFAENFYRSNTNYYKDGDKHIIKIISCTGDFLGKTGFIVIDVSKNKRLVYIKFD